MSDLHFLLADDDREVSLDRLQLRLDAADVLPLLLLHPSTTAAAHDVDMQHCERHSTPPPDGPEWWPCV